jgi:aryl-alcohol dehydrogenase-like predicted oxidoreductase
MEYRRLGSKGLEISTLTFGAMMFGRFGTRDHDDCIKIIHRTLDSGVNSIDTADVINELIPPGTDLSDTTNPTLLVLA